jgi:hypothetical protein
MSYMSKLLPSSGYLCVGELLPTGKFKHHWVSTPEEAQNKATALDKDGKTVFVAQGSFTTPTSRGGDNAAFFRNFFLDIDCGAGKPYATQADGLKALYGFCKAASLPAPTVVSSGNGLYAHWMLQSDLPAGLWLSVALLLKAVVNKFEPGLDADSLCADRARVLRPVGATHRKDPNNPKTVRIVREEEPVNTFGFVAKLKAAAPEMMPAPKAMSKVQNAEFLSGLDEQRPSSAEQIATKCAQIAHLKAVKGDVAEPYWYAMIGLLRFTTEGEGVIHEWSSGHSDYSRGATDAKIRQHERSGVGPTTCARFHDCNPDLCQGCVHAARTKSPITLGYTAPAPLERTPDSEYPDPPYGFTISKSGVSFSAEDSTPITFYPYPLWVSSVNADHFGESVTIRHKMPHVGWREITLPANKLIEPKLLFSALIDAHVQIIGKDNKGLFMSYIEHYVRKIRDDQKVAKLSGQMGWVDDDHGKLAFIHGPDMYLADGTTRRVGYSASAPDFVRALEPSGETWEWVENTRLLNREELKGQAFAFLCGAFGSALVKFTGYDGCMVAMVGGSGKGKSLVGNWGLSAWGDWKTLTLNADDTRNALVGRLGVLNSLPAYIDEIGNVSAEELSSVVLKLTQGRDKLRMNRNAVERSNYNTWSLLSVVSSNHSLIDKLAAFKGHAVGEFNRLFEYEIPEDCGVTAEEGKLIGTTYLHNYGHIGRVYAKYLVENQDKHFTALNQLTELISKKSGALPEERFWVMTAATAVYGGMIAKNLGLCHIDINALMPWIYSTIKGMRKYKLMQQFDAVSFLGSIMDKYNQNFLVVASYDGGKSNQFSQQGYREPRGSLVGRIELDKNRLWLSYDVIKRELARLHLSSRKLATELRGCGLLNTGARIILGRGTLHQSVNQTSWEFDLNNPALGNKLMAVVDSALKEAV